MTKEEVRFQVALSCIQGVLEAKHGIIGEIVPEIAVKESLRIADEFVKQWLGETTDLSDFERAIHRGFLSAGVENVPVTIIKETAQECLRIVTDFKKEDAEYLKLIHQAISSAYADKILDTQTCNVLRTWLNSKIAYENPDR